MRAPIENIFFAEGHLRKQYRIYFHGRARSYLTNKLLFRIIWSLCYGIFNFATPHFRQRKCQIRLDLIE